MEHLIPACVRIMFIVCKRAEEIRPLLGTDTHSEEGQSGNEENETPTPQRQGNCPRKGGSGAQCIRLLKRTHETQTKPEKQLSRLEKGSK